MKKFSSLMLATCLTLNFTSYALAENSTAELVKLTKQAGYNINPLNAPKAAILIEAESGQILWENNADLPRDPASVSKVLTLYLVYEAISRGELSLDTKIVATQNDELTAKIHEISNNNIIAGVAYPVEELIKMVLVPSSNSATVMLANHLSNGDADKFIDDINAKAQELGMTNTHFNNPTGAVARAFGGYYKPTRYDNHAFNSTTVRDLAILCYNFLKKYPGVLQYTSNKDVTTMAGTPYAETFQSYNHSLPGQVYEFPGVDGFKTGSSPSAGFNIMATAKQGNLRLIVMEMGVGDWADQNGELYRHPFINGLFKKGFDEYENRIVLGKGEHEINGKKIELTEDFNAVIKKGQEPKFEITGDKLTLVTANTMLTETTPRPNVTIGDKNTIFSSLTSIFKSLDTIGTILLLAIALSGIILIMLMKRLFSRK